MELTIADLTPFLPGLEDALDDDAVSEVMINEPGTVFVERAGPMAPLDAPDLTAEAVARAAVQIARPLGKDPLAEPVIDARLADGSRLAICGPPAAPTAAITIRRFGGRAFTVDELTASGSLPAAVATETAAVLRRERNVLISGGTGSGKTTLLNALVSLLPAEGRVISIEDTLELRLRLDNGLRFEARGLGGRGVTIRDLVRHRPDHIVVGEVRGAEAADLLQAFNNRPRREPGHGAREQRRGCAVTPRHERHAGIRRAAVDRRLPRGGRRHRGRHPSDANARRGLPRRPDGARPRLRRKREPLGGREGLAADRRCGLRAGPETAGRVKEEKETATEALGPGSPVGAGFRSGLAGRRRGTAALRGLGSRAGAPLLQALAPVAVGDDLGRAGFDDLPILRREVLRQLAPRVMSAHRCGPPRRPARRRSSSISRRYSS